MIQKPFWSKIERPILALAPMAGYTESPFRRLVKSLEPSVVLTSELLSAEAFRRGSEKTLRMAGFHPDEKNVYLVQLFGNETEAFVQAAKIVEDMGADGIDLNLGCPSPKVIGSGHGSALLRDPSATARMIETLVQSTHLPVSIKMRLGFYNDDLLEQSVRDFERAGIQAITIHGRTTVQKFSGTANWEPIYQVKKYVSIPIIGNGDITSAEQAVDRIQNLDGIMIGRGALTNPWIFPQMRAALKGEKIPPIPPLEEQLNFFRRQARLACEDKGEHFAMIELRKHFAHFVRGIPNASRFRERLIRVESLENMEAIFEDILYAE